MKNKRKYIVVVAVITLFLGACEKEFLQKPDTTGISTVETVFSSFTNARAAIANVYQETLKQGLPYPGGPMLDGAGTLAVLAGEHSRGWPWLGSFIIVNSGMNPSGEVEDLFNDNYETIRKCYTVYENIDNVPDINEEEKESIKAEMLTLIAYRYMGMFYRYGGVPIVDRVLDIDDEFDYPRSSLQSVLDEITRLTNEAFEKLPNSYSEEWNGRVIKGIPLAIRARALMYAARPLFNSSTPYWDLPGHNELINFGEYKESRWQDAIEANEKVISWIKDNDHDIINTGGAGINNPNPNAFKDYATATSRPGNPEVLLAYKWNENGLIASFFNISLYSTLYRFNAGNAGVLTNFLVNYYDKNGQDVEWVEIGKPNSKPAIDYINKMQNMEPRFLADNKPHGLDPANNPGDQNWSTLYSSFGVNTNGQVGRGAAFSTKYYYNAGARVWIEFPLFRSAEFYLNLAEAYNEVGNVAKALENLNIVHNRAGLPSIVEQDKEKLREIIQREWAIEYYNEIQRYFLVKHWKLKDIGNGIIGGAKREFQFTTNGQNPYLAANLVTYYDQVVFNAYWGREQFLTPFPQEEVNKGVIVQNPGY